jgi:hypothetical protein
VCVVYVCVPVCALHVVRCATKCTAALLMAALPSFVIIVPSEPPFHDTADATPHSPTTAVARLAGARDAHPACVNNWGDGLHTTLRWGWLACDVAPTPFEPADYLARFRQVTATDSVRLRGCSACRGRAT